jgi:hypothetical protein
VIFEDLFNKLYYSLGLQYYGSYWHEKRGETAEVMSYRHKKVPNNKDNHTKIFVSIGHKIGKHVYILNARYSGKRVLF